MKKDDKMLRRTENNRVVNFDGNLFQIGEFVDVQVTEVLPEPLKAFRLRNLIKIRDVDLSEMLKSPTATLLPTAESIDNHYCLSQ